MGLRKGARVRIVDDGQGDLPVSILGRTGVVAGRVRSNDMSDGERAYAVVIAGRKNPRTMWETELRKK